MLRLFKNKKNNFFRLITLRKALFFLSLIVFCAGWYTVQATYNEINSPTSIELGFTSLSPAGSLGGEIIPASCASGYAPHTASGDGSCNMFVLSVDAASVPYNGSTTIRWSINPNYNGLWGTVEWCQAEGNWSGAKSTGGGAEETGALTPEGSLKTYTLRCQVRMAEDGALVEEARTVTVNVGGIDCRNGYGGSNPNSCNWLTLTADNTDIGYGDSTVLRWRATGYNEPPDKRPQVVQLQRCDASGGWSGEKAGSGTNESYTPEGWKYVWYGSEAASGLTGTQTFTLTCSMTFLGDNTTSVNTRSVTVNVGAPPVVNRAPDTPRINGPRFGYPGAYNFSMAGTDPDNDQVRYGMDWDNNGSVDEWTPYVNSGASASLSRNFVEGNYTFRALAQDTGGASSSFSPPHSIRIIAPPCACDRNDQVCSGQNYQSSGPNCATTTCNGSRACSFYWQEVSP